MPKKIDDHWLPDARGRYKRKVGYRIDVNGTRKHSPFNFGKNKEKAKARLARVRELWEHVREGRHKQVVVFECGVQTLLVKIP